MEHYAGIYHGKANFWLDRDLNECPKYNLKTTIIEDYNRWSLYIFGLSCIMVTVLHWRTRSLHKD